MKIPNLSRLKELVVLFLILIGFGAVAGLAARYTMAREVIVEVVKLQEVEKNPIKIIKQVCEDNGCDWTLCIRVAAGESQFKPYARLVNKDKTTDRGIFMFNDFHYKWVDDDCAYDTACATKTFCDEVKGGHLKNWVAAQVLGLVK